MATTVSEMRSAKIQGDDDRCRRIMKSFRKRRRERSSFAAAATGLGPPPGGGIGALENPRTKRRTGALASSRIGSDDGDSAVEYGGLGSLFLCRGPLPGGRLRPGDSWTAFDRRNRVKWGEGLVRKRAFGVSSRRPPAPELVHRKPENIREGSSYINCQFLDPHDRVLAVDNSGNLDLIRLADLRSQTNDRGATDRARSKASHEKIATDFEFGAALGQKNYFYSAHVQVLAHGSAVAFGFVDNTLCLLDLEGRTNYAYRDHSAKNDGGGLDRVPLPVPAPSSTLPSSSFRAWRAQQLRRKYYRDRRNPSLSIHELCRDRTQNRSNVGGYTGSICETHSVISNLLAIDYSNGRKRIASPVRFVPGYPTPEGPRWDILEVRPGCHPMNSLLYVARVDPDYDSFWTQVLDSRVGVGTGTTTPKTDGHGRNATTVFIDGTTRDHPGKSEEHVTTCAMVTDICMATGHVYCGNYGATSASDFFDQGLSYPGCPGMSSCVKLWDLRMARKKRKPRMMKDSLIPTYTIALSSPGSGIFEHANIVVAEPSATIHTRLTSKEGSLAFSEATFASESGVGCGAGNHETEIPDAGSDFVVRNLSASRDSYNGVSNNGSTRCGSLMVTCRSFQNSSHVEHCKLDLSGKTRTVRKVRESNSITRPQPLWAVDPSHKFLAICNNDHHFSRSHGPSTRLYLYDLKEGTLPTLSAEVGNRTYFCPQQREDSTFRFRTDASLTDRYDMKTELSCIAVNSNATALLGASSDGDLFVWRGI